jgi:pilus assembly protein Flp/PilA
MWFLSKFKLEYFYRKKFSLKGIYFMLFAPKEKGQGLVEYAIILALIAIVVIAVMTTLGKKVNNTMSKIGNLLPS